MSYLVSGNNPAAIKTAERNIFTATASQTTFTITQGYQPGDIDVYLNGIRLVDNDDFNAINGSTVVLTAAATLGDSVVVVCYRPYQVTDFYTKSEQDTRYVNTAGDTMTGQTQIWNTNESNYASTLANSVTRATLQLRTHSSDTTLTTVGSLTAGDGYLQRSNGPGTSSYNLSLNPFGGAVLMPNQPVFEVMGTGASIAATTARRLTYTYTYANIGSYMVPSTGRFTAPVSGTYQFHGRLEFSGSPSTSSMGALYLIKNGESVDGGSTVGGSQFLQYSAYYSGPSFVMYLSLVAGDYIELFTYGNNGGNGTTYSHRFGGRLIA